MPPVSPSKTAPWVLAAAHALNEQDSWTGRVHIHKHLFITQVLRLAVPPFDFVLYDYGPYSFELDEEIVNLEMFGFLSRSYPQPGYGPRYEPTALGLSEARSLPESDCEAIKRVAKAIGGRKSLELELIATCLWFERKEGVSDRNEVVRQVTQAKPKYDEETIRRQLDDAHALIKSLAA